MQPQNIEKKMSYTIKKDKIFNVRKVNYKQLDNQKYLKPTYSPFYKKQIVNQSYTNKPVKKECQYNYQVSIISSPLYKQLALKYKLLKQTQSKEKQKQLQELRLKQQQLIKFKAQKQRIQNQRIKLIQRRNQLRNILQEIREKNQMLNTEKYQRNEEYRIMNMEYLRNMIMGVRYQNGMDIDLDNMTYQELLQLEQKIGNVSKGLTQDQIQKLNQIKYTQKYNSGNQNEELCSICYYNFKQNQEIIILPCEHKYHKECIHEWLLKQKICPMCKQQIQVKTNKKEKNIEKIQEINHSQVQKKQKSQ